MPKGKVLFIDDDNFLRKVYQAELSEKGYEVYLAVDGEEGMSKTASLQPDLIILDLIMPKKNGFEVLADLSRYRETKHIPVIVLSNLAQSDDQKRALDLGAKDYLVKDNTTLDVIAEKIDRYISAAKITPKTNAEGPSIHDATGGTAEKKPEPAEKKPNTQKVKQTEKKTEGDNRGHNFCPNCGYQVENNAKFCPDCGQQL